MNGNLAAESKDALTSAINNAAHWQYKSEGELNLVLSYRGDFSSLYGKVLR